ncbi:parkin co-regulated protein domain-containing protein [Ditylenchus destructor]|uniref:Parkin co-regulated protein domain-containing protein n=1 Tax=Ditylenchus destructor TaxID=166010 RepID=A0AAD4NGP3_9BILA|nr:parkin co-regulated protein domain-containing protein [Ditylenchus destructor]
MISFDVTRRVNNPRFRSWSMPNHFCLDENVLMRRDVIKDNKRQQILFRPRIHSVRRVPAFTIQTEQMNTKPFTPALGISSHKQLYMFARPSPPPPDENLKQFLRLYEDRQFPIRVLSGTSQKENFHQRRSIEWQVDPNQLKAYDRRELLRRFAVGLAVEREPYSLIAIQGFKDLLSTTHGAQMLADSLTDVIPNLRKGLNSPRLWKKLEMLELLRQMAQMTGIGVLLVPFYRMLLPPLRIGKSTRVSTDITTSDRDKLHNAIDKTLIILEQTGGPNAYINIKYLLPEYQSFRR